MLVLVVTRSVDVVDVLSTWSLVVDGGWWEVPHCVTTSGLTPPGLTLWVEPGDDSVQGSVPVDDPSETQHSRL